MSSEKQDESPEQDPENKTDSTETDVAAPEEAASEPDDTIDCPNCGRTFSGTYCPDCGQEVGKSLTMTEIAGNALGDASGISGGLWETLVGLTIRPRQLLQRYLRGERKQFMSPGRYLTVAVLVWLGSLNGLIWLGLMEGTQDLMNTIPGAPEAEPFRKFQEAVGQLAQSQWLVLVASLLSAVMLGLIFWRLFGDKLHREAEALAVAVFLISHSAIISAVVRLLYVLPAHAVTGRPVEPGIVFGIGSSIMIIYPGIVAHICFGTNWRSAIKAVLGAFWAQFEVELFASILIVWYIFLSRPKLIENLPDGNPQIALQFAVGFTVLYSIPLLLHAAVEAYYRLGSASPQPENQ